LSGSINHYKRHAMAHLSQLGALQSFADVDGSAVAIISLILRRGDPFNAIQNLKATPFGATLPNSHQLVNIVYMLKERVQQALLSECAQAQYANFALDGWSDPTLRRYQGITVRLIRPDFTFRVHLLAFKYMEHIHETRLELDRLLQWVTEKYKLQSKVLNRCTDRASINLGQWVRLPFDRDRFFGDCWMPCACHVLNNFLGAFVKDAHRLIKPVLQLQAAFRSRACFIAYLIEQKAPLRAIPSFSEVRWYSAFDLFEALETMWPYMVAYAAQEKLTLPQLSPHTLDMIIALKKLARAFVKAQRELEADSWGTGSRFAGHLMAIKHRVAQFAERFRVPLTHFNRCLNRFMTKFHKQWCIFVMLTILDPGVALPFPSTRSRIKRRRQGCWRWLT
jgi:hypothetical protein